MNRHRGSTIDDFMAAQSPGIVRNLAKQTGNAFLGAICLMVVLETLSWATILYHRNK